MIARDIVLLHSPLVGPSSLEPTRACLEQGGYHVHAPSPYRDGLLPAWHDWPAALAKRLPQLSSPVFVGHSMATLLAARLAAGFKSSSVICLDGDMPPVSGPTPPVAPGFRQFLATLPRTDGCLPPWHEWWPNDVLEGHDLDPEARTDILAQIPSLPLAWFDDSFEMPDWSHANAGFIQLDAWFDAEAGRAEASGWPVVRIAGTHLHPALAPIPTSEAIVACITMLENVRQ